MTFSIHLSDQADPEIHEAIIQPLREYNFSHIGSSNARPLVIAIRNNENKVMGGYWGGTDLGWLTTSLLIVPAGLRGLGLGTQIMQTAEQEAIARGCHGSRLDTFEFQAREFYEKLGYNCFGTLTDYPIGFSRFFMQKSLAAE